MWLNSALDEARRCERNPFCDLGRGVIHFTSQFQGARPLKTFQIPVLPARRYLRYPNTHMMRL